MRHAPGHSSPRHSALGCRAVQQLSCACGCSLSLPSKRRRCTFHSDLCVVPDKGDQRGNLFNYYGPATVAGSRQLATFAMWAGRLRCPMGLAPRRNATRSLPGRERASPLGARDQRCGALGPVLPRPVGPSRGRASRSCRRLVALGVARSRGLAVDDRANDGTATQRRRGWLKPLLDRDRRRARAA